MQTGERVLTMYIEVKFHGGEPIVRACTEACALTNRICCDVHFKFNDVYCMALQGGDADVLVENFQEAARAGGAHPIATTHPKQASRYTCFVEGCPGDHVSKWEMCVSVGKSAP